VWGSHFVWFKMGNDYDLEGITRFRRGKALSSADFSYRQ
jgi:hypothetical protein